jgi:hypothetical protein
MFIAAAIAGCLASGAACSEPDPGDMPAASKPFITRADISEFCYAEGVVLAPNARSVLLETISRASLQPQAIVGGRLAIATTECLDRSASGCALTTISSVAGVANGQFRRSGDGIVFIANTPQGRPGYVFEATGRGADLHLSEDRGRLDEGVALAIRFGDSDRTAGQVADDLNTAADKLAEMFPGDLRTFWGADRYLGALSTSPDDLDLSLIDPDGTARPLGVKQPYLLNPLLASTQTGADVFASGYRWSQAQSPAPLAPFSYPVLSSRDGSVIGRFSPRAILLDDALAAQGRTLEGALNKDPGARLVSVAAHPETGAVVALARAFNGDALTYIVANGEAPVRQNRIACGGDRPRHEPTIREAVWGSGEDAIPITLYETPGSRQAVVLLHGGPGGGVDRISTVAFYVANGFSVVVPAYGTSLGVGTVIASKLATLGMEGQSRDARTLSAGIAALKRSYRVVGVHAESFGASLLTNPSFTGADFTIAVAPYLRHRDPGGWTINRLSQRRLDYQRRFEAAFFGDGDFISALDQHLARWTPASPHLILIAGRDDYAPASDTAPLESRDNVERVILPDANHATIFSEDVLIPQLRRYLETRPLVEMGPKEL